jgi:hypothetical protein
MMMKMFYLEEDMFGFKGGMGLAERKQPGYILPACLPACLLLLSFCASSNLD